MDKFAYFMIGVISIIFAIIIYVLIYKIFMFFGMPLWTYVFFVMVTVIGISVKQLNS